MKKSTSFPDLRNQNIITTDYEDEMRQSYIDYAMSVIASRALPDIRDGLKPVQRRTLFAMKDLNLTPDKSYRKSARIVGDTMGKYHPHGDTSIYDAMVRMAQSFSMNEVLIDGHGNFGSIDGDSSAAMRYTEAKLAPLAMELLEDLEKEIVPMTTNFDETLMEPKVMPAKFPNALVNGMTGIAVGMATNFPTHNLREVINGTIAYIENPEISVEALMTHIQGPDFPTGGIITNKQDLMDIYATGKGRVKIRSKIEILEDVKNSKTQIIIREIPYTSSGNKDLLIESIVDLIRTKKVQGIADVRDESSRGEIEVIVEVKKGCDAQLIANQLLVYTKLEDTFSVNMLALLDQRPFLFNLKSSLEAFVVFQREIYTKKYRFLLDKENDKKEVTEGLLRAYDEMDVILEAIRGAKSLKAVKNCLMTGESTDVIFKTKGYETLAKKFHYSERQATMILEMRLYKLIGLEKIQLEAAYQEILKFIAKYEKILGSMTEMNKAIIAEMKEIGKQFGQPRRTVITDLEDIVIEIKEEVELVVVLIDERHYMKAVDQSVYEKTADKVGADVVQTLFCQSNESIYLFDKTGNVHQIKVENLQRGKVTDKGVPLSVLTDIVEADVLYITLLEPTQKLLFVTTQGYIKIVEASELISKRTKIAATKLGDTDSMHTIRPLIEGESIIGITQSGYMLRCLLAEVPELKKSAAGVLFMKLEKEDVLKDILIIPAEMKTIQVKVDQEIQKKNLATLPIQKRNAKGKQVFKNKLIIGFVEQ